MSKLTYAAPACGQAAKTHFSRLQTVQNKMLRIFTKRPRVTPSETLQVQTGTKIVRVHVSRIPYKYYLKISHNEKKVKFGQFNPMQYGGKKIRNYIQYFLHLVFFSLCAFLRTVFVLRVLLSSYVYLFYLMCICCTLYVFVVHYVYLLYYVFVVPYMYLLYLMCICCTLYVFVVSYVYLLYLICI